METQAALASSAQKCSSLAGSSLAVTWDGMNLRLWQRTQESGAEQKSQPAVGLGSGEGT